MVRSIVGHYDLGLVYMQRLLARYSIPAHWFLALCHCVMDRMSLSPILSVIQPATIATMLNNNGPLLNNRLKKVHINKALLSGTFRQFRKKIDWKPHNRDAILAESFEAKLWFQYRCKIAWISCNVHGNVLEDLEVVPSVFWH